MAVRPPLVRVAADPAGLQFSYSSPAQSRSRRLLIQAVERAGGQRRLKRLYEDQVAAGTQQGGDFFALAVAALGLDVRVDHAALARVPSTGPILFVANHPYGVLDGLVLTWLASQVRPDVKVLANALLCRAPGTWEHLLPVDFDATEEAQRTTLASRIAAQKWLKAGHAVGIFPGGGVSTSPQALRGPACDPPWHPFTAKLILGAKATVVPVYFAGQNSRLFQIASHLSYTLRLSLLFRETVRRIGTRLEVSVGAPIAFEELAVTGDRLALVRDLRHRTFALAQGHAPKQPLEAYAAEFHFPRRMSFR